MFQSRQNAERHLHRRFNRRRSLAVPSQPVCERTVGRVFADQHDLPVEDARVQKFQHVGMARRARPDDGLLQQGVEINLRFERRLDGDFARRWAVGVKRKPDFAEPAGAEFANELVGANEFIGFGHGGSLPFYSSGAQISYATSSSRSLKYLILSRNSAARSNSYFRAASRISRSSRAMVSASFSALYSSKSSRLTGTLK